MTAISRAILAACFVLMTSALGIAGDRAIIVLDASGSMWGQIDGKPKLEIARETLKTVLQTIPADMELGLMAYGHREKGSCDDIELVVPPATGTSSAISTAADGLKFLGKTPLSAAVKLAAEDLKYTEDKATVILITDGLETCSADPCAIATELEKAGVDFTAHVVGFGLTAEEGKQVACLAENTGGKYIQASDAEGLKEALEKTVVAEPAPAPAPEPAPAPAAPEFNFIPHAVMAAGGSPLTDGGIVWEIFAAKPDGAKGDQVSTEYDNYKGALTPGDYLVRAVLGEASVEQPVKIEAGKVVEPVFVLNAAKLTIRPRPSAGGEVDGGARLDFTYPGGSTTSYGETKIYLPAGETVVKVGIGSGEVSETLQLSAGQVLEKDIVVGVGRAVVNALYAMGGDKVDSSGLDTKIFKAAKKIDGSREQVTYAFGPDAKFDLSPGDYVAVVQLDQAVVEQPFTVKVDASQDVTAVLNAGVLAITAPGAKSIKVFAAKKDIQGERKQFGYGFDGAHQTTLPAGDYVVTTDREDGSAVKETPATVKAGEREELTIQ